MAFITCRSKLLGEKCHSLRKDFYGLKPIDEADANAMYHDLNYDKAGISGLKGVLSKESSSANEKYNFFANRIIGKYYRGMKDNVTGKPVTEEAKEAAEFGRTMFRATEDLKEKNNEAKEKKKSGN